jgi:hypothetical protein
VVGAMLVVMASRFPLCVLVDNVHEDHGMVADVFSMDISETVWLIVDIAAQTLMMEYASPADNDLIAARAYKHSVSRFIHAALPLIFPPKSSRTMRASPK